MKKPETPEAQGSAPWETRDPSISGHLLVPEDGKGPPQAGGGRLSSV